jgi:hypothetical protein
MKRFFNNLRRSCRWFKRMWNNYDFDDGYLIEVIVWKMKDMLYQLDVLDSDIVDLRYQEHCKDNGYNGDLLKSLEECIEIGERLIADDYIIYPEIVEKWKSEHKWSDDMPDDIRKLLMDSYEDAERRKTEDNEKFFDVMKKYHWGWWS